MSNNEKVVKNQLCSCGQTCLNYDGIYLCLKCNGNEILKISKEICERSENKRKLKT